jgi:hypothetical protein
MSCSNNAKIIQQVWDVNSAVDELKELLRDVSMFPKINNFIESGKSAFVISKFDTSRTELTGKIFVTYQLADELKVLLGAVRANKIDSQIS